MNELKALLASVKFANDTWMFLIPGILMAIDVITGTINAWAINDFKSFKMREGLIKKFGEVIVLVLGELFTVGMNLPAGIMVGFSAYIILMELISICENLKKMGVPIPKFISKALSNAENTFEGDKKDGEDE